MFIGAVTFIYSLSFPATINAEVLMWLLFFYLKSPKDCLCAVLLVSYLLFAILGLIYILELVCFIFILLFRFFLRFPRD